MKQNRISRSIVEKMTSSIGLRLVIHQNLGNRKNYYYTYSVVRDENGICAVETLISDKTLKEVYNFLGTLLENKEWVDKQINKMLQEKR